jgi:hypothetical protein
MGLIASRKSAQNEDCDMSSLSDQGGFGSVNEACPGQRRLMKRLGNLCRVQPGLTESESLGALATL